MIADAHDSRDVLLVTRRLLQGRRRLVIGGGLTYDSR